MFGSVGYRMRRVFAILVCLVLAMGHARADDDSLAMPAYYIGAWDHLATRAGPYTCIIRNDGTITRYANTPEREVLMDGRYRVLAVEDDNLVLLLSGRYFNYAHDSTVLYDPTPPLEHEYWFLDPSSRALHIIGAESSPDDYIRIAKSYELSLHPIEEPEKKSRQWLLDHYKAYYQDWNARSSFIRISPINAPE